MRMRRLNNLTQSKHDREADDEELTKEESEEGYEKGPRSASTRSSDDDETRPCSVEDSLTLSQMYRYRGTTPSAPTPSTPFPASEQEVATSNGPKPQNSPGHAKSPAMIRAEEIQSSLGSQFPSFTRLMGLPKLFSKSYLPRTNTTLVLEDETGEQFDLKYIAEKTGLSGGWRRFAVGHNLLEGDALVFHMVRPNKFKVTIQAVDHGTRILFIGNFILTNVHMEKKVNG
ncbi:hypothetical protein RJ639_011704 [Escallonia herrerae]|uniref:TF-B3 domain-containing protein n=1 Tax=Escallonia herrerae TaxID=1293975 RepID=A0AA88VKA9_9ASTE|nr:hypothetical protein RJ639_011704 [Escallonia herrerae]